MNARLATVADHDLLSSIVMHPAVHAWNAHDGAPAFDPARYTGADGNSFAVIVAAQPPMVAGAELAVGCFLAFAIECHAYTVHTNLLPVCRGARALEAATAALEFAFIRTDAEYLTTNVPEDNSRARWFAHAMGFRDTFRRRAAWLHHGRRHDVQHMRLGVDDWIEQLTMAEMGRQFHRALIAKGARVDHPEDAVHDAYVGASWAMTAAGQINKGLPIYNRYARSAGYKPFTVASTDPLRIDIGTCVLRAANDDFIIEESACLQQEQ